MRGDRAKIIVAAPTLQSARLFALKISELLIDDPRYVTELESLRALGPEVILFWVTDVSQQWNEKVAPFLHRTQARVLSGSLDQVYGVIGRGETS